MVRPKRYLILRPGSVNVADLASAARNHRLSLKRFFDQARQTSSKEVGSPAGQLSCKSLLACSWRDPADLFLAVLN